MPSDPPRRYCCDQDFERLFDEREAEHDLTEWREHGPRGATQDLIDALRADGVEGASLLDIGGGVGMVHLELLAAGAARAVDVDASAAFLAAARSEAERRGLTDQVEHRFGDVVELAADLPPADVVTLDRVICCYPNLEAILRAAMAPGPRLIGLVHPHDTWWMRSSMGFFNAVGRLLRRHHSFFVYRTAEIDRLMREGGFIVGSIGGGRVWRVAVYRRSVA
jgi:SAM-dependent methyltransferase